MKIKEITTYLEAWAPLTFQENYDNCGLLTGSAEAELNGILITLDCTEHVVLEAIQKNCNLIIAHHPILFKSIKSITGKNYVERTIILAIKNDISIYAIHTNLDNVKTGVNSKIAHKLNLQNERILEPKSGQLKKLVTFVPFDASEKVAQALFSAGGGKIGNYSECSFVSEGVGSFKPNHFAKPFIGIANHQELVNEKRIEVIFPAYIENSLVLALKSSHPYEEPAFDIISLGNQYLNSGSGMIGDLPFSMSEEAFLLYLKDKLALTFVRFSPLTGKKVSSVALCGGSGSFLIQAAKREKADVFISSDFKYHEFFDAENQLLIADINHYEGEVFTKDLIYEYLTEKITNIALVLSDVKTNPINYL
jgi:dinuclear metal center YbgI/SA1388 family protein